LRVLKKTLGR